MTDLPDRIWALRATMDAGAWTKEPASQYAVEYLRADTLPSRDLDRRELIAKLEAETACANRDIAQFGEWQWNHAEEFEKIELALARIKGERG